jgi:hypothetical protein
MSTLRLLNAKHRRKIASGGVIFPRPGRTAFVVALVSHRVLGVKRFSQAPEM